MYFTVIKNLHISWHHMNQQPSWDEAVLSTEYWFYWFCTTDLNGLKILLLQVSIQFVPFQMSIYHKITYLCVFFPNYFKALHSLNAMRMRVFSNYISAWWLKCFNDFILFLSLLSVYTKKSESMPEQYLFCFTKSHSLNSRRDTYMRYLEQNLPLGLCFVWGIS